MLTSSTIAYVRHFAYIQITLTNVCFPEGFQTEANLLQYE